MWLVRHLERIRRATLEDLKIGKMLCNEVVWDDCILDLDVYTGSIVYSDSSYIDTIWSHLVTVTLF